MRSPRSRRRQCRKRKSRLKPELRSQRNKMAVAARPLSVFMLVLFFLVGGSGTSGANEPGVKADSITFGQSSCFSGPCRRAGLQVSAGILAAFHERNLQGGVNGRRLELVSRDHEYQAAKAAADAMKFAADNNVFAIIGGVGSPTARRMAPILRLANIPFVGPVSGADFLRDRTRFPNVVNLRSSYREEMRRLVSYMFNKLGARRFGVIYQDDAFGRSVLNGYHDALKALDLPILAKASYSWHAHSVHSSVFLLEKADLDVVMLATTTTNAVDAINMARTLGETYVVGLLSIVNTDQLRRLLDHSFEPAVVARITPDVRNEGVALVRRFRSALARYKRARPEAAARAAGPYSLEGYIIGRFVIAVLERMSNEPTREEFLASALATEPMGIDDWVISFAGGSNEGSDYVRLIGYSKGSSERVIAE
ncbi:MAG: ABC transporter substrate-binding protein [Rhodospirillaceae bacterium]|nr:ABC transporter substrate-binding protein [Rhodospirillaceae bacterium]